MNRVPPRPGNDSAVLASASGLSRALSGLPELDVRVQAGEHPHFLPVQKGVDRPAVVLPALPQRSVDPQTLAKLRAWLYHETVGEARHNRWLDVVRQQYGDDAIPQRLRMLCNGLGDAILDRRIAAERPGAGIIVRGEVRRNMEDFFDAAPEPDVGALAALLRYIGEGLTDRGEAARRLPKSWRPWLDKLAPELDALEVDDQRAMVEQCQRIAKVADGAEPEGEGESQDGGDDGESQQGAGSGASGPSADDGGSGEGEGRSEGATDGKGGSSAGNGAGAGAGEGNGTGDDGSAAVLPTGAERSVEAKLQREIAEALDGVADDDALTFEPGHPIGTYDRRAAPDADPALTAALTARLRAVLQGSAPEPTGRQRRGKASGRDLYRSALDGRCFERQRIGSAPSVAVGIALDRSSSMHAAMDPNADPDDDPPKRIEVLRQVAAALQSALQRLDVPHAVVTFNTRAGWIKRLSEPAERGIARTNALKPTGGTSTAEALHPLLAEVLRADADHRVLLLVSDGQTSTYGRQWQVLQTARNAGVGAVALGIGIKRDPSAGQRHAGTRWPAGGQFGDRWIYVADAAGLKRSTGRALQRMLRQALRPG